MLGAIVILSVAGSLYQNIGAQKLSRIVPNATPEELLQLTSGRYSRIFQSLTPEVRDRVVQEVSLAIRNGFLILVAGSAIAFVSSFFLSVRFSLCLLSFLLCLSLPSLSFPSMPIRVIVQVVQSS